MGNRRRSHGKDNIPRKLVFDAFKKWHRGAKEFGMVNQTKPTLLKIIHDGIVDEKGSILFQFLGGKIFQHLLRYSQFHDKIGMCLKRPIGEGKPKNSIVIIR